eukprot:TRINITY_DN9269_c0_g1_i4.p1 TRINITY_DN9269_c0_g1~~TRINITY_DN9269_c0_g1_i4.p1  ORF type:complete len:375 (-),score=35.85 TRINITY_DN9269_c0_g1_i4:366-1349(-)
MVGNAEKMHIIEIARMVRACAEFNNYSPKLFSLYLTAAIRKFYQDRKYVSISELCYACYLTKHYEPAFFDAVVEHMVRGKEKVYYMNRYEAAQFYGMFAQFDIAQPDVMIQLSSAMIDKTDNRDCDKLMTAMFSVILLQQPAWMCREICDHFMSLLAEQYKVVRRKIRRELPKDWYLKIYLCHVISDVFKRPIPLNDKLVQVSKRHWKENVEQQAQSEDPFKASVVTHLDILGIQPQPNYIMSDTLILVDIVINLYKRTCVQLVRPGNLAANNKLLELHPSVMSRKLLEQLRWKVVPINQYVWDKCDGQNEKLDFLQNQFEKYKIQI